MNRFRVLTQEQVDSFMTNGYLVVHDCFDHAVADRWIDKPLPIAARNRTYLRDIGIGS